MAILVTGGAGFIGSHVCDALLANGSRVICVDNFNAYYSPERKRKNISQCMTGGPFSLVESDFRDVAAMKPVFEQGIGAILHLGGAAGVRYSNENPQLYEEVNVRGTLELLELAKQYKVPKFIYASTSSVYGNTRVPWQENNPGLPLSVYAATKRAGEHLCATYHHLHDIDVACLRFFTVYGPRGRPDMAVYKFTDAIAKGKPLEMYGDGNTLRDYTYVSDIVAGVVASLKVNHGFEVYNLGNNRPVRLSHLIELIEKEVGSKAIIEQKPEQPTDPKATWADITRAQDKLGYQPKVPIEEGVRLFVQWYKEEVYKEEAV